MSNIRGRHNSPGTYIKFTDVRYRRSGNIQSKQKVGGGVLKPDNSDTPEPLYWVISMRLPGVLSGREIE